MHHGVKDQEWYVKHGPPYPLKEGAFEGKPKSVNKQKRARVEANEDDRDPKKKKKKQEESSDKPKGVTYKPKDSDKEEEKLKAMKDDGRIKGYTYDSRTGEYNVQGMDKRTYARLRKESKKDFDGDNFEEGDPKQMKKEFKEAVKAAKKGTPGFEIYEDKGSKKPFKLQKDQDLVAQKMKAKEDERKAKQEEKRLKLEAKLEKQKAKAVEAQAKADREAAERAEKAKRDQEAAERKAAEDRAERDKKFMKGQKSTDDLNILTNDELEKRTARLNLEKNYLSAMKDARPTNEVVKPLLKDLGKKTVTSFATAATVALGEKVFENLFDGKKTKKISFTDYFK